MGRSDEASDSRPPERLPRGAVLGIDPGERRVGLALCPEGQSVAVGLPTFQASHGANLLEHLRGLIDTHQVTVLVVGHPRNMDGSRGAAARQAEALARRLRRELGLPVELQDERLTTVAGRTVLRGEKAAPGARDRIAATLILQIWLDRQGEVDREA
jgi:putative Holliday junction resolvase